MNYWFLGDAEEGGRGLFKPWVKKNLISALSPSCMLGKPNPPWWLLFFFCVGQGCVTQVIFTKEQVGMTVFWVNTYMS